MKHAVHMDHGRLLSKRKEGLLIHATTWMNVKEAMLRGKRQSQKDIYCMIPSMLPSSTNIITEMENRLVVARGWGAFKGTTRWSLGVMVQLS